jgi:sec-independent protein translocase protein TatA
MLVVLVIALLVFGPSKVPQLGDALGKGIRNFKKAVHEAEPDERPALAAAAAAQAAPPPRADPTAAPQVVDER